MTSVYIRLDYNKITSIPSGSFNYPNATSISINLNGNQISLIAPSTFSQGNNEKWLTFSMRDFILTLIKFTNSKLFLQAIFHSSCPWPITNWRNSNRMSSKRRWREWLNTATITISYPSQEVWVKAITRSSIQQFHLYSICLFDLQMQSIVKAVVSPGSSGTIVSSWNMLKVELALTTLPSPI